MSIRILVQMQARSGEGDEFARLAAERCLTVSLEEGCDQFEVFRSTLDPDKFTLLILWRDQAALDAHNALAATQQPGPWATMSVGSSPREDYPYNPTR